MFGGQTRTYRLFRPTSLRTPAPLVVMLHGGFGTGQQAENAYHWDEVASASGFAVLYPDGLKRAWNVGGGCCGVPGQKNYDDVGFVSAAVQDVMHQVSIDGRRIFATGISNGGMLSYALACRTTLFAAIAPDSATQLVACPNAAPVSVLHIHGTADTRIRFDGSPGIGVARIDGPSVPDVIAAWRAVDRCGEPQVVTSGVVTRSTAQCPAGRAVELITITGAGHQWPGGVRSPLIEKALGLDPPSTALNATQEIWQFFASHPGR